MSIKKKLDRFFDEFQPKLNARIIDPADWIARYDAATSFDHLLPLGIELCADSPSGDALRAHPEVDKRLVRSIESESEREVFWGSMQFMHRDAPNVWPVIRKRFDTVTHSKLKIIMLECAAAQTDPAVRDWLMNEASGGDDDEVRRALKLLRRKLKRQAREAKSRQI